MVGPVVVEAGGGVPSLSLADMLCYRANSAIPPLRLATTVLESNSFSAMQLFNYYFLTFVRQ